MIINEKGEQEEQFQKAYAFEDVLLVPQYSEIESRKEVDLTNNLGPVTLTLPVISSPWTR